MSKITATTSLHSSVDAIKTVLSMLDKEVQDNNMISKQYPHNSTGRYRMSAKNAGLHVAQRIVNRYLNKLIRREIDAI